MTCLDWDRAAKRELVRERGAQPVDVDRALGRRVKGPTNEQRHALKLLAKERGEPTPMPKSSVHAEALLREWGDS